MGLAATLAEHLNAVHVPLGRRERPSAGRHRPQRNSRSGLMPQGQVSIVPDDQLTTRQRRNRPLLIVHTGDGKGKSTAAFGLALRGWNQGFRIGVFQFVKSAKWRIGEQTVLERLGALHTETGEGGPVEWHKMGSGWSWSRKAGTEVDHAQAGGGRLGRDQATPGRRNPRPLRARRVHLPDQLGLGRHCRRHRNPRRPARPPARRGHGSQAPIRS